MKRYLNNGSKARLIHVIVIVTILISLTYRYNNIDHRFYWFDEIITIEHTSGIQVWEHDEHLALDEVKSISYYKEMISLNERELSIKDQLKGISGLVKLNPLQYVLLTFWHRLAGDSTTSFRLFSLFMFILCIPLLYYLIKRSTGSVSTALIAILLFSISPFYYEISTSARWPILSTFLLLLNLILFIEAEKRNKAIWWGLFIISSVLMLYATIIAALVILAELIYVAMYRRDILKPFAISSFIILLAYSPWLTMVLNNLDIFQGELQWHTRIRERGGISDTLYRHLFSLFFLIGTTPPGYSFPFLPWEQETFYFLIPTMLMIALILLALPFFLGEVKTKQARYDRLFLILLIVSSGAFLLTDIIRESKASVIPRYQYISILALLYFLSRWIGSLRSPLNSNNILLLTVIILLPVSTIIDLGSDRCTYGPDCQEHIYEAEFIDQAGNSLIITDMYFAPYVHRITFYSVIAECDEEDADILYSSGDKEVLRKVVQGQEYEHYYVMFSSEEFLNSIRRMFPERVKAVQTDGVFNVLEIAP